MTETRRVRFSRAVAWKRSLSSRSSSCAADERRLERLDRGCGRPARRRRGAPARRGTGAALPLRTCSPASSKAIALEAARWVASPTRTRAGWRRRLEPRGGIDQVARDHALVDGADRDRGLAGQDAGPGLDPGAERRHRGDEVQRRPDGALGVVLVGDGCAPDRHDRVADELLDRAAVPADDVAARARSSGSGSRGRPRHRGPRRTS